MRRKYNDKKLKTTCMNNCKRKNIKETPHDMEEYVDKTTPSFMINHTDLRHPYEGMMFYETVMDMLNKKYNETIFNGLGHYTDNRCPKCGKIIKETNRFNNDNIDDYLNKYEELLNHPKSSIENTKDYDNLCKSIDKIKDLIKADIKSDNTSEFEAHDFKAQNLKKYFNPGSTQLTPILSDYLSEITADKPNIVLFYVKKRDF